MLPNWALNVVSNPPLCTGHSYLVILGGMDRQWAGGAEVSWLVRTAVDQQRVLAPRALSEMP